MEYIYIGKLVNTHGIKGEVRILSGFEKKDLVFKVNNYLYIGKEKTPKQIISYRPHKCFDMVCFKDINDIQEVLKYKGSEVYFKKEDLHLEKEEFLEEDLINMEVYFNDKKLGHLTQIINNNGYKIMDIENKLIPYNNNFIKEINLNEKIIILKNIEGLINEN